MTSLVVTQIRGNRRTLISVTTQSQVPGKALGGLSRSVTGKVVVVDGVDDDKRKTLNPRGGEGEGGGEWF